MNHVIVCPEYPPAPIPAGGIGRYVVNISRALAEVGETVHVVGLRWSAAPKALEEDCRGRLIIHRVALDERVPRTDDISRTTSAVRDLGALAACAFPEQRFAWQAARAVEELVEREDVDVIEAQEWQAPLYYFLLRRALGRGPRREPPCLIHLHSPTELIFRHNDWDPGRRDYLPCRRHEEYTIGAADALLCPSRYFARQAERHYGLAPDTVTVIPLPLGPTAPVRRAGQTWTNGSICYVGRLEPRKGLVEWIDAAVEVAREEPAAHFDFVGADLPYTAGLSVGQYLAERIPERLRHRFRFHGARRRARVAAIVASARIAVVPSRWENFPNTCVEAMASGLPVIATREGGMAEMIDDGRTGWLAPRVDSPALAATLRRALRTPPTALEAMGARAAVEIRRRCDDRRVVSRHIALRRRLRDAGAARSRRLAPNLPWARRPLAERTSARIAGDVAAAGIALIVTDTGRPGDLATCLAAVRAQTEKPAGVFVVVASGDERNTSDDERIASDDQRIPSDDERIPDIAIDAGWHLLRSPHGDVAARIAGLAAIETAGIEPLGVAFVDASERPCVDLVASCASALQARPEVGVVSFWWRDRGRAHVHPCPAFPYQWLANHAAPASVIRTEALREAGGLRASMTHGFDLWDVVNAVMAAGWAAVTVPAMLSEREHRRDDAMAAIPRRAPHRRMHRAVLDRFPALLARDAAEVIVLAAAGLAAMDGEPIAAAGRPSAFATRDGALGSRGLWRRLRRALHDRKRTARRLLESATTLLSLRRRR